MGEKEAGKGKTFPYTKEACRCQNCLYHKKGGCVLQTCCCMDERVRAHTCTFAEAMNACGKLGVERIPILIREISREEAVIAMVDSNLQREKILPSEKARAYKMKMDAMKRQGKRTDLTSSPMETKLRTDEIIAKDAGESRNQIQRYILF